MGTCCQSRTDNFGTEKKGASTTLGGANNQTNGKNKVKTPLQQVKSNITNLL